MDDSDIDRYLESIYFDPSHPASFGGVNRLSRYAQKEKKISPEKVKQWLSRQDVYVKHKPVRKNFKRLRVVVPRKLYQLDADTVSMTRYDKHNSAYKYILVIVDILTRFCWACPLKSLTGQEMTSADPSLFPPENGDPVLMIHITRLSPVLSAICDSGCHPLTLGLRCLSNILHKTYRQFRISH